MAVSLLLYLSVASSTQVKERAAMESCAFNYVEGKGHADLMKLAAKWHAWASKNRPTPPSALILSPVFVTFEEVSEGLWLDFSPASGESGAISSG